MRFPGRGARASNKESAFATTSTLPDNALTGVNTALVKDELRELQLPEFQLPEIEFEAGFDVPLKAERLLGGRNRKASSPKAHGSSAAGNTVGDSDDWSLPNLSDRRVDDRWGAQSTHEHTLEDTMPGANGGLKPWPNVQQNASMHDLRAAGMERPRMPAAPSTADSRQYIPRDFSDPTLRSHYDPARQPLNISQQTSASAVRDMALRKGSAASGAGSRNEAEEPRRPLKSAMKNASPEDKRKPKPYGSTKKDGGRRRRLDFGHLLHRNHSSGNVSLHPQFSSSTSLSSDPYLENPTQQSRFKQDLSAQHKPASSHSDPAARTKIFEKDVYDSAKVNVRRPPKGIQNWFDGFDISSDEEEQRPTELPAADVPPPPVRKDSNKGAKIQRPQADIGSLLEQPNGRVERPYERQYRPQQSTQQTQQHYGRYNQQAHTQQHQHSHQRRNPSDDIVEDNMQAIEQARQQMHARQQRQQAQNANLGRKASDGSVDVHSLGGSTARTGSESRLGKSKLAKESVLSLSDTSEDEKPPRIRDSVADSTGYEGSVRNASHMDFQRPSIAPRQLHGSRSFARDTCMTNQTSGSIPITLSSDPPIPLPVFANQDSTSEHTAAALRRLIGRSDSSAQKKNGSKHASSNPEYEDSNAGETVSSFPSEQSHMMAVSDEEMVLLEMMRIKRAAMQKNSFTEGYQQALKREQEQLTHRRQSAQKTALKILKQKKDKLAESKIDEEALDEEQRRRLSILKQEDVDNQLKIERFFASETPLENVFPEPPSRSRAGSEQHSNAPTEELLLPRTYTPQPPQSSRSGEGHSQSERRKNTASPLLPSPSTFEDMDDDDLDEAAQLEADLSRFLASGGRHESVAFPQPPKSTPKDQRRKSQGLTTLLSPSLSPTEEEEEDVVIPRIPSRSPRRDIKKNRAPSPEPPKSPKSRSEAGSTGLLSPSTPGEFEFDPYHAVTPSAKRGTYTSIISSYQAHHRTDPIPDVPDVPEVPAQPTTTAPKTSSRGGAGSSRAPSPSLSTSRASPMTPTFAPPALNLHNTSNHHVEIAGSDNPSPRTYASSDQSSLRAPSKNAPKHDNDVLLPRHQYQPPPQRKKKAPLPSPIETLGHENGVYDRSTGRVGSVGSFTSASEDVLAAWAELGGGNEGFASKSRGRMRAR